MANVFSLGRVNVPAGPVPMAITTDTTIRCSQIIVAPVAGMTGKLYFGVAGLARATGAGVIKEFIPSVLAAGFEDIFQLTPSDDDNVLRLSDFWIDGAVAGEGLYISYVVQ